MYDDSARDKGLPAEALARLTEGRERFLTFIQKRVASKAAAEDILQAAFVRGLEKGASVRDRESIVAWFYRVLRNAIIDYYRQQGSDAKAAEELAGRGIDSQEPDDLSRGEICQCIATLLDSVKPEYREAIQVVELEEGSLGDLAAATGISANNAAVRVHRARAALRKQVAAACGICATHGCLDCHCNSGSR